MPFRRFRSIWLIAASIICILGLALLLLGGGNDDEPETPLQFTAAKVGSIYEIVTAQGKLEPKEFVDVGAQVSGQLKKIYVEIGDVVQQGDLLAEIDPRVYEARVQGDRAALKTLEAQLAEQEAEVAFAEQQHARNQRLIASKAVSQEALEESATALTVAKAKVNSLTAQIEQARSTLGGNEANLSYTKIYAPMAGTVVLQPTREGQTVNASQQAPVIVQLADLDTMTVRAQVAEADVMRLREGMEVSFSTLGSMEKRWKGKVRQILPSPEIINDVVLYNALVDVENKDRQLMSGMSTQMFFALGAAENVLVIPVAALGKRIAEEDNTEGQAYQVQVKKGNSTETRTIHAGLMNRSEVEVRSGVAEGEEVAIAVKPASPRQGGGGPGFRGGPRL